jgi:hypothetical protein
MIAPERYPIQSDQALFGNFRLAWKGLLVTKALAYFCQVIGEEKGLITLTPEDNDIKLFFIVTDTSEK